MYTTEDASVAVIAVSRTTIDLDDEKLAAAAHELGTTSKTETVNAALVHVAGRRQRDKAFDDPRIWGSSDLADPEVRAQAGRVLRPCPRACRAPASRPPRR
jgi:Arc/MetJ family transcription regulator